MGRNEIANLDAIQNIISVVYACISTKIQSFQQFFEVFKQKIDIVGKVLYISINKPATPLPSTRILAGIFLLSTEVYHEI